MAFASGAQSVALGTTEKSSSFNNNSVVYENNEPMSAALPAEASPYNTSLGTAQSQEMQQTTSAAAATNAQRQHNEIDQDQIENGSNPMRVPTKRQRTPLTLKNASALCTFIAIGLVIASSATQSWATYEISSYNVHVGLWSTCIEASDGAETCKLNDWESYAICGRTATEVRDRFHASTAMGLFGALAGLIALFASYRIKNTRWTVIRVIMACLMVAAFTAVVGIFVHSWEQWYFSCPGAASSDLCDYFISIGAKDCSWSYSYSFYLACVAMPLSLISALLTFVSVWRARNIVNLNPPDSPGDSGKHLPSGDYDPPAGYIFDEDSGMYWGAADELYFSSMCGCYYDPKEQSWFVPKAGEWLDAEDVTVEDLAKMNAPDQQQQQQANNASPAPPA